MALKRKPMKNQPEPEYPDSEKFAHERRTFLVKLGAIAAAGLATLAGCGSGAQHSGTSGGNARPATAPIGTPPVIPQVASPGGVAPALPEAIPQAATPGKPAVGTQNENPNVPVRPIAPSPGIAPPPQAGPDVAPVPGARPQASPMGSPPPPQVEPARPQAAIRGEAAAPEPVRPQAQSEGGIRAPEIKQ
jgi:hypothetical protein